MSRVTFTQPAFTRLSIKVVIGLPRKYLLRQFEFEFKYPALKIQDYLET